MHICDGLAGTVGNTPLIRLNLVSELTGCEIYGKAEFLNPGGSVKDRTALYLLHDAEERGRVRPGYTLVDATAGNTGIGLALLGRTKGYDVLVVMPDDQSQEKIDQLRALGVEVRLVPPVSDEHPDHYRTVARRLAASMKNAVYLDQFDNPASMEAHFDTTGPEIWEQTHGRIDAFVCGAGTGGTLAGVSRYLKQQNPDVMTVLADNTGSALFSYVKTGELRRVGDPSIIEGIGNTRVTANLEKADIDDAVLVDDLESLATIDHLLFEEGLFVGGSSGLNVAAAVELARMLGPRHTVVTMLCDGGSRYLSKLFNPQWRELRGYPAPADSHHWMQAARGGSLSATKGTAEPSE